MTQYMIVDEGSTVVNVVTWDGVTAFTKPDGTRIVAYSGPVFIGGMWDGVRVVPPGGDPQPVPLPAVTQVTMAQARVALRRSGLLSAVEGAVSAAGGEVQDAWEYSHTVHRTSALVMSIGDSIGLTPQQIDDLFAQAADIAI